MASGRSRVGPREWSRRKVALSAAVLLWMLLVLFILIVAPRTTKEEEGTGEGEGNSSGVSPLRVGTYNLWNFMFHWKLRKVRVAEVLRQQKVDVIGFQEVRQWVGGDNQLLHDLLPLLPTHKWAAYQTATYNTGQGQEEGVAIASRFPIVETSYARLTSLPSDPDKNTRVVLRALIEVPGHGLINFFVTHWSYDKNVQCRNSGEVLQFVNSFDPAIPQILLGDFNAYVKWDHPTNILQLPKEEVTPCTRSMTPGVFAGHLGPFRDSWKTLYPKEEGLTFSNMPWPGLESRPDRIMTRSNCLKEQEMEILEDGAEYRKQFYWSVVRKRAKDWIFSLRWDPLTALALVWIIFLCKLSHKLGATLAVVALYMLLSNSFGYIAEEFFTSDHRLLVLQLQISC